MRSESDKTVNGSLVKRRSAKALKRLQSTPRTKRKIGSRFAGLTQSWGAVHEEIVVAGIGDPGHVAKGITSSSRRARHSIPPKFARKSVERLPRTTGTSTPPEIASRSEEHTSELQSPM